MKLRQELLQIQEQQTTVIWVTDERGFDWCFQLKPRKKAEARRRGYKVGICSDQQLLADSWRVLLLWGVTGFSDLIQSR